MSLAPEGTVGSIDRIEGMPPRDYRRRYVDRLRPVIIIDAIRGWPAVGKWTPEFFRDRYPAMEFTIDGRTYRMDELIDRVLHSTPSNPAPYLTRQRLRVLWPELVSDISPIHRYAYPNWLESPFFPSKETLGETELLIGGEGARFPQVHYDVYHIHAVLSQIYGDKEWFLYPPDQTRFLYPRSGIEQNKSMIDDVESPDLTRFPLFAHAKPVRFVLKQGETLFVPAGWWHTTRLVGPSITVSVNTASSSNWTLFRRDYTAADVRDRGWVHGWVVGACLVGLGVMERLRQVLESVLESGLPLG